MALGSIEIMGGKVEITEGGDLKLTEGKILGNDNFRGSVTLPVGENSVSIEKAWDEVPVSVTLTPDYLTNFAVVDLGSNGFTILVDTTPSEDRTIYWTALW